jgi:glycosyltransferase involved in cell wall biosynthesis
MSNRSSRTFLWEPHVGIALTALSLGRSLINHAAPQHLSAPPRFGVLGTHPPALCGVAGFSAALVVGLEANGADVTVVRVADGSTSPDARVVGELVCDSAATSAACADLLNRRDIAVIHHNFGIYGGANGAQLVDVIDGLRIPSIVVAHEIPADPTASEKSVFESIMAQAAHVVVTSDAAARQLNSSFAVERHKVSAIAHGATIPLGVALKRAGRPTVLTWGLLGPGKGVERVIDSMGALHELRGRPQYLIAGPTHPKVVAAEGEAYREARIEQVRNSGLTGSVVFDPAYRSGSALAAMVQSSAVVVLPYDASHQVSSGALVNAVASGRPVVATAFPHAVELLGTGAGIIVDHDDPEALTSALRKVLSDPRLAGNMAAEGRRLAPTLAWPKLAASYLTLAQRLLRERRAFV